jgi:hypothetical protein
VILRFADKEDTNIRALMRMCAMAPLGKSLPVTSGAMARSRSFK